MSDSFTTPWTIALQAPPSMGFSRQKYWGGLPFPSPGDLPDPEIEPSCPTLQAGSLPFKLSREAQFIYPRSSELNSNLREGDSPGGPLVKNLPSKAEDGSSIPGQGTKTLRAMEQLSIWATTRDSLY